MEFKSVYELNESAKALLEGHFSLVSVEGEISRLTRHSSGHWYFTLKDDRASISATMFKGANARVNFIPKDGMKVLCTGKISIYSTSGTYQINVSAMKEAGLGDMDAAFRALKEKLQKEGLFDLSRKKPLPRLPRRVGIVTSLSSAAFADIKNRIESTAYFLCDFICFDTLVQGRDAPASIINALKKADNAKLDAIILARGGGSKEDLWCFNDENLAYTIASLKTPIISAVGHEIDYSISDFVADHRSITPTASIVDLLPSKEALMQFIDTKSNLILNAFTQRLKTAQNRFEFSKISFEKSAITGKITKLDFRLKNAENSIKNSFENRLKKSAFELEKTLLLLKNKQELFALKRKAVSIFKDSEQINLDSLKQGDKITLKSAFASKEAQIL